MLKQNKSYNLTYWTKNKKEKNLGDYLGHVFLDLAGLRVSDKGLPFYFSIGTSISSYWWNICKGPKIVWGSGSCGSDFPEIQKRDEILAVRGPLSRDYLGLSKEIPLGDPALLISRLYEPINMHCGPILVENFHSSVAVPKTQLNMIKKYSMKLIDDNWKLMLDLISSSDFVFANSLHSAIIAHSYKKPWVFYAPIGSKVPFSFRWKDWFSFLGLPIDALKSIEDLKSAIDWWDTYSPVMKKSNLDSLVDTCPWPELHRLLK
jgi:hypothetical protein